MINAPWGVHWFRRDLRLVGNPALNWNCKKHEGRVLGIFCFDRAFLARPDFSINRFSFFLESLNALRESMRSQGGDLLALDAPPSDAFPNLLRLLRDRNLPLPGAWSWNRDYEPFARARDASIEERLREGFGIEPHIARDHLLIEPRELSKDDGSFYQVYTPFKKKWLTLLKEPEILDRLAYARTSSRNKPALNMTWQSLLGAEAQRMDRLEHYRVRYAQEVAIPLPPAGEEAALRALKSFRRTALANYGEARDFPAIQGTSHLSIYLKNGSITVPRVISELSLENDEGAAGEGSHAKFLSELIWREFYYHLLYHVPRVESGPFQEQYFRIPWENRKDFFEAWQNGLTGYPIVDAAMRELKHTGFMHNRARMIVASFLTKDLHIDWRWGEKHFMNLLLDGDLAANNGGWQWAASTGCDAQPYFRVFNPWLQGKRFDPDGAYIRRWIPELAKLSPKELHTPREVGAKSHAGRYPSPIVDHSLRAKQAIAFYRAARHSR